MKIAVVMPRHMYFGPDRATSIDLVVHDIVTHLPDHARVMVYAEQIDQPFTDVPVRLIRPRRKLWGLWGQDPFIQALREDQPDVIVVEQHLPSAVRIARAVAPCPVILHAHAFPPRPQYALRRILQVKRYQSLARVAFVSQACLAAYDQYWAKKTGVSGMVIPNGMDLLSWNPQTERTQEILCVGRLAPEKGILELAQALALVLPEFPDWRARFILTGIDVHPAYCYQVMTVLRFLGPQIQIETHQPWPVIKAANEAAAIAVVPSLWQEPFGRTALEAMAGGAALIASTRGGLNEVVGKAALCLDHLTPELMAQSLRDLLVNPGLRMDYGAKGRAQAVKFSLTAQVEAFVLVCQQAMDSP